jgi:hypothetical protein
MAALDLNRLASSAAEAYLREAQQPSDGRAEEERHRRLGRGVALATGAGLALAGHAAYRRIRHLDLERLGRAAQKRLTS